MAIHELLASDFLMQDVLDKESRCISHEIVVMLAQLRAKIINNTILNKTPRIMQAKVIHLQSGNSKQLFQTHPSV